MANLRNFLYLEGSTLDDYLGAFGTPGSESSRSTTNTRKKATEGRVKGGIISGGLSGEELQQTQSTFDITDASKFETLYQLLENESQLTYLDLFDEATWRGLNKREIIEIEVDINLPENYSMVEAIDEVSPIIELMQEMGETLDPDVGGKEFAGFQKYAQTLKKSPIPFVGEAIGTPGYKVVGKLSRNHLRCHIAELNGEVTIFAKIQRMIGEGQSYQLFSLLPAFASRLSSLNKGQREKANKSLAEFVEAPAAVVLPLAIYR